MAERLRARYPDVPSRLIVTGEPPYPNAKVYSLDRMLAAARHDLLVMSDSDIRVTPEMLHGDRRRISGREAGAGDVPVPRGAGAQFLESRWRRSG